MKIHPRINCSKFFVHFFKNFLLILIVVCESFEFRVFIKKTFNTRSNFPVFQSSNILPFFVFFWHFLAVHFHLFYRKRLNGNYHQCTDHYYRIQWFNCKNQITFLVHAYIHRKNNRSKEFFTFFFPYVILLDFSIVRTIGKLIFLVKFLRQFSCRYKISCIIFLIRINIRVNKERKKIENQNTVAGLQDVINMSFFQHLSAYKKNADLGFFYKIRLYHTILCVRSSDLKTIVQTWPTIFIFISNMHTSINS